MVAEALEEYAPAKQRYLQRLDVDIYAVPPPGVGAEDVGDDGAKEAIEVGEEEDGTAQSAEKACRGCNEQHATEDQLYQEKPVEHGRAGQRLGRESSGHGRRGSGLVDEIMVRGASVRATWRNTSTGRG
jgi:hypothetical protein